MKTTRVFSLSIFFFFLLGGMVAGEIIPVDYPFRLEGTFSVEGVPAAEDHTFSAYVDGELYKTLEMGSDGYYAITVGGEDGDEVSLYVDGSLAYEDVSFEAYGIHYQDIDITEEAVPEEPDTGSGDSGDSGSSGGGSSSSSGGGSSSFTDDEDEEEFPPEETGTSEEEDSAVADIDVFVSDVANNTTEEEQSQNGLASITGNFLGGLSDFGISKILFVILALVVVVLALTYYHKNKKIEPSQA